MATDTVNITSPVKIQADAASRVAFDLMDRISRMETISEAQEKSRDHWLTLYCQCYRAANGAALQHVLDRK